MINLSHVKKIRSILWMIFIGFSISIYSQQTQKNVHYLGEKFGGGIIFYIDETGQHGLIASPKDLSNGIKWGKSHKRIGATEINNGLSNTLIIVKSCDDETAASICTEYINDGYDDWYLPSLCELQFLYQNRLKVDGLTTGDYCSSTEATKGTNDCWAIHFGRNGKNFYYNKSFHYCVRAIRKF